MKKLHDWTTIAPWLSRIWAFVGKEEPGSGGLDILSKSLGAGVRATPLTSTLGRLPCHLPLVTNALLLPSFCQQAI